MCWLKQNFIFNLFFSRLVLILLHLPNFLLTQKAPDPKGAPKIVGW